MIKNIYINGFPLHNPPSSYIVEVTDTTSSDVELNTYNRGGRDGVVLGNALYRSYVFSIGLKILGNDPNELHINKDRIMSQIRLNRYSDNPYKVVTFELENGSTRSCNAVLNKKPQGEITPETSYAMTPLTFQMIADRNYLSGDEHTLEITAPSFGGMAVPMSVPMDMTNDPGETDSQIVNAGNTESQPIFHVTGPCESFDLLNITTDQRLIVTYPLSSGEYIDLSTYDHSAFANGVTNMRGSVKGEWPVLAPGPNQIVFSSSGGTPATSCQITYNDAYLGI